MKGLDARLTQYKDKYSYGAVVLSVWQIVNIRCPFNLFEESFKRISLKSIHSDRKCSSALIFVVVQFVQPFILWLAMFLLAKLIYIARLFSLSLVIRKVVLSFPLITVDKYFTKSCLFRINFVWVY